MPFAVGIDFDLFIKIATLRVALYLFFLKGTLSWEIIFIYVKVVGR